jgi:YidC/Oxa1 family membrane protein insertase
VANRTWLAVVLSCLVWFVYERWFAPPVIPLKSPITATDSVTTAPVEASKAAVETKDSASLSGSVFSKRPELAASATITNREHEIVLSDMGGKIQSIRLLGFTQTLQKESPKIESLSASTMPHSLGTYFSDASLAELGSGKYQMAASGNATLFEKTASGVTLKKVYSPSTDGFFTSVEMEFQFPPGDRKDFGYLMLPLGGDGLKVNAEDPLQSWEVVSYQNETVVRKTLDSIKDGQETSQGTTNWVAFGNRYFSNAIVNESTINPDVIFEKNAHFSGVSLRFPLVLKDGERKLALRFRVFSGPKEYSELSKVPGLKKLIDYGMFSFLAYPLLELLRFFFRFVHNYGVAIILLTLVVRVLFYPLSLKSYRSMKGMQKLQPQLVALKEKYKDDAQKFAQEQMALFRTHKVNPAGGCLPILVQLPVFIALYAVLQNSIELFHAPFFGWVLDLSAKDPYYVFPVLMGVSMFVQQKMTPAAGMDPTQQKILLLMPVIFSVVMFNLPSGLTAYIFLSTLLGILQQVLMNRERDKASGQLVPAPSSPSGK